MNKLIIGLSCLGVFLMTSCDNEHSDKIALPLEKVNFSAHGSNGDLTLAKDDKVTLYINHGGSAAKYYTDSDRSGKGKTFPATGQEFTLGCNGSIEGGFYLTADTGKPYTLKKFDINKKADPKINYVLKEDLSFKVKTGQTNTIKVVVVDKKEASVAGAGNAKGTKVGFSITKGKMDQYQFNVVIYKPNGTTLYNSTSDKASIIILNVKNGSESLFKTKQEGLFAQIGETASSPKNAEVFTITLPRELAHYGDDGNSLKIEGSVTTSGETPKKLNVKSGSIKSGNVALIESQN